LNADTYIRETLELLVYGKTSIINTIQHSDTFNTHLAALIVKMEAGIESGIRPPRIGSVAFALREAPELGEVDRYLKVIACCCTRRTRLLAQLFGICAWPSTG
jgi:hypothetical protein